MVATTYVADPQRHALDLRPVPPGDRLAHTLRSFDDLEPGEVLVLTLSEDPSSYLHDLRRDRQGQFEWSPIDHENTTWQVEIARRPVDNGARRRVTESLAWDHDRLDDLEGQGFAAAAGGDLEAARRLYATFSRGLNRHIRFEEELLFPVFDARTGLPGTGPTALMREEHRRIRMLLDRILASLSGAGEDFQELRAMLREDLDPHNRKEEQILYPTTDTLLTDAEADSVVARMQSYAL